MTWQRTPCLKTPCTSGGLLPAGWELPSFFPASRPIGLDQHKVPNGQPEGQQGCHRWLTARRNNTTSLIEMLCYCYLVTWFYPTLLQPHGLQPTRLLCLWDPPGKNTGVGSHFLLQGIFLTQGLNPGLLHCRWILYCWPPGKPSNQDGGHLNLKAKMFK